MKEEFIKARVTPTEKKELRKLAELRNMKISQYIRLAIQKLELDNLKNSLN